MPRMIFPTGPTKEPIRDISRMPSGFSGSPFRHNPGDLFTYRLQKYPSYPVGRTAPGGEQFRRTFYLRQKFDLMADGVGQVVFETVNEVAKDAQEYGYQISPFITGRYRGDLRDESGRRIGLTVEPMQTEAGTFALKVHVPGVPYAFFVEFGGGATKAYGVVRRTGLWGLKEIRERLAKRLPTARAA